MDEGKREPVVQASLRGESEADLIFLAGSRGPTCTSDARTGSVGAKLAARSSAAATGSPAHVPRSVIAAMLSGIVIPRSLQVTAHRLQSKVRSIFRPAPMRAMMTITSVNRSVISG